MSNKCRIKDIEKDALLKPCQKESLKIQICINCVDFKCHRNPHINYFDIIRGDMRLDKRSQLYQILNKITKIGKNKGSE